MSRFEPKVRSWSAISRSLPQFAPAQRHQSRRRFTLERLEGRSLLSTVHLTVNTLADDPSGSVAGQTTLRDAITAADAGSTTNKYVIKFAVDGTIALSASLPALSGNIDINGPGSANLTIQRQFNSVFQYDITIDTNSIVKLSGLTVGSNFAGDNAFINNQGTLVIKNDTFSVIDGGAIANTGSLLVNNSTFTSPGGNAGYTPILNFGTAKISFSSFSGGFDISNSSPSGAYTANEGVMTVRDCVFTGDDAISNESGGIITITSSTFSDHEVGLLNAGTMNISHCTFVGDIPFFGGGDNAIQNDGAVGSLPVGVLNVTSSTFSSDSIWNQGTMTLYTSDFNGVGMVLGIPGSEIYPFIVNLGTATIGKKIIAALGDGIYNEGTLN